MTDIDAIRKADAGYDPVSLASRGLKDTAKEHRRQLLSAYDAKCEELANACALGASLSSDLDAALIRISQLESRLRADLEHIRPLELGALSAFEQKYDAMRAERDAAHREKAAAMGLVEGHALTIAKLEAERDAAVRDAQRIIRRASSWFDIARVAYADKKRDSDRNSLGAKAASIHKEMTAWLAALAPPTEQPCSRCHGKTTIKTINLRRPFAGAMTEPCPDCQPSDREVMP